jgi:DNA-binding response OmpR family regulator
MEAWCMRVLVIEDEVRLADTLRDLLEIDGYTVDVCHDGEAGLDNALSAIYDVVLLDVMLPKLDGFTVLRRLRAAGDATPVLMLTAKAEIKDRISGLDMGADDYLTKPFSTGELLARLRAVTRRKSEFMPNVLTCGNIRLNKSSYELSSEKAAFRLGNKEFQMMEMLMSNPTRMISTEQFMERIWGYDSDAEINVVWVYISYLRKKLSALEANVEIKAARGVG